MSVLLNGTPIVKCIEYCAAKGFKDTATEAAAQLAKLHTALEKAREAMLLCESTRTSHHALAAWLEEFKELS